MTFANVQGLARRPRRAAITARRPAHSRVIQYLLALLVALSVVGYPLAGVISIITGWDNRTVSIPFRLLVDLIAAAILFMVMLRRDRFQLNLPLVLLLVVYLARMVWDLQNGHFTSVSTDLIFYLATAAIPAVAVGFAAGHWRDGLVAKTVFYVAAAAGGAVLFLELIGFYSVVELTEETGRLTSESVNPITWGQAGASLMMAVCVLWFQSGFIGRIQLTIGAVIGGWLMVIANSRSPFVSVALAVGCFLVATRRWKLAGALVAAGLLAVFGGNVLDHLQGSRLITVQDASSAGRLVVMGSAWADFTSHPFFGTGYLDSAFGQYPHNILLESGMAMGGAGFLLVFYLLFVSARRSFRAVRGGDVMLAFLFWQAFSLSMLSGALFGSGVIFMLMMVLGLHYGNETRVVWRGRQAPARSRFSPAAAPLRARAADGLHTPPASE